MSNKSLLVAPVALITVAIFFTGCCNKKDDSGAKAADPLPAAPVPTAEPQSINFNRVPLSVTLPAGWQQTQNSPQWLVYRPEGGGALVAMSGEKSCSLVTDRFAGALRELGLTNVIWKPPQDTRINGNKAKIAEGTAIEASQLSYVKYSLTYASGNRGCLITLYNVWQSKAGSHRATADDIIMSVRSRDP